MWLRQDFPQPRWFAIHLSRLINSAFVNKTIPLIDEKLDCWILAQRLRTLCRFWSVRSATISSVLCRINAAMALVDLVMMVSGSLLSKDPKDWTVTLGEHHLKNEDWFEQIRKVKAIYLHPGYKESENKVADNKLHSIPPDYDVGKMVPSFV